MKKILIASAAVYAAFLIVIIILIAVIPSSVMQDDDMSEPVTITIRGTAGSGAIDLEISGGISMKGIKGHIEPSGAFTAESSGKKPYGNKARIWSYLKGKGFSDASSAAIMGCWMAESRCDPSVIETGGYGGHGLAQWTFGRCSRLLEAARKKGVSWKDLDFQLDFFYRELSSSYMKGNALSHFKADDDFEHALRAFFVKYESGGKYLPSYIAVRSVFGKQILMLFRGKTYSEAKLSGKIKGGKITIEGEINGIPLYAGGTVKNGKVEASGWLGEMQEGSGEGYIWPMRKWSFCRGWGVYTHTSGYAHYHQGIDIYCGSGPGPEIINVMAGKVVEVHEGAGGASGKYVMVHLASGLYARYQHLSKISVRSGQSLAQGERIGEQGNTPSGMYHLHFDLWKKGSYSGAGCYPGFSATVDPLCYLPRSSRVPSYWYEHMGKTK